MSNDMKDPNEIPDVSGITQFVQPKRFGRSFTATPEPEASATVTTPDVPAQTQQSAQTPDVVEYTKPDGSVGQFELPTDPSERKKKIAELASGRDAYLAGRDIIREKAPELSDEWRTLLKGQQEILSKVVEQQQAQQQAAANDPANMLTEDQRAYYESVKENGDEQLANAYLRSAYNQNMMLFDMQKRLEDQQRAVLEQKVAAKANEFRQLDPTLPNPRRGGKDAEQFARGFNTGYGGWLQDKGFSEQQIWFADNIDHATLYKIYQQETGQSQSNPQTTTVTPPVKTVEAAKAVISPEVAKSIQDVARGSVSSAIGGEGDGSKYANVHGRAAMRQLAQQDPKFMEGFLEQTGIARFLPKKK